jgi:hypothetical protein
MPAVLEPETWPVWLGEGAGRAAPAQSPSRALPVRGATARLRIRGRTYCPVAADDENSLVTAAGTKRPIQTPALMSRPRTIGGRIMQTVSDDHLETVIAEYIRANGVSRCPTACVSPTQGWVPTADRMALAEYAVARDRRRERPAALNPADAEREDGLAKRSYRRLSPEQVARCRDWNENMSKLADEFGVSPVTIFKVRQRYTYKELP